MSGGPTDGGRRFLDQMGRTVVVPERVRRIVSLVPSQTELLYDLGLSAEVVGRTSFCIHPREKVDGARVVGGTKRFRFDVIDELRPDLIIGNKEENYVEGIERLAESHAVWMSDIETLDEALDMIRAVGDLVHRQERAEALATEIEVRFGALAPTRQRRRVAYLIWRRPYMAVGAHTFIHDLLVRCGFDNVFASPDRARYPEVTIEEIRACSADLVLLSSEPFPFDERHREELAGLLPDADIRLVDGEMFSWYGSRLLLAGESLRNFVVSLGGVR